MHLNFVNHKILGDYFHWYELNIELQIHNVKSPKDTSSAQHLRSSKVPVSVSLLKIH
jgi:hypothetical protein